ncbi:hypothetical protein [Shewanella sp. 6_MG-2023]|uniref:hypothetical protein n=1 Tax=Shewanella sp. 6_MG-2023 TaxID=3062660 RepID=UPI0026E2A1DB|nr:hypothetical protein [Shewanella sp. 6_MG-2023]MDO6617438.1 hypothetical protein [Shewanella sp. 6_MG-2023]
MPKEPIPKEMFIQYAEDLLNQGVSRAKCIFTESEMRNHEKGVALVMLAYAKGLIPYKNTGGKSYSKEAAGLVLAFSEHYELNDTNTENFTGVGRRLVKEWKKSDCEVTDAKKQFWLDLFCSLNLNPQDYSFNKFNSKHGEVAQIEIIIPNKKGHTRMQV